MKKTILTLIVIISLSSYSQCSKAKDKWNGFTFYIPTYTKHFVESKRYDVSSTGSQGGDRGLIVSYSKKKTHYSIGYMKNSYGDWSKLAMFGYTLTQNRSNQLTINIGIADNYAGAYSQEVNMKVYKNIFPEFMINNNILGVLALSYKKDIFKVVNSNIGLQLNVSPIYVNAGVFVKL